VEMIFAVEYFMDTSRNEVMFPSVRNVPSVSHR